MIRALALVVAILAMAGALIGWNVSRFEGASAKPRTKDLAFLPPPALARTMSLGQPTAAAKLRWIDSFAYFQLQLERQDDTVAGDGFGGGFTRLYDTLIALDPSFVPFYEHAVLNTGGVLKQHDKALGFALKGTLAMPEQMGLWRMAAAELAVPFSWTQRQPAALDRFLAGWELACVDAGDRQSVIDWRRGLAFQNVQGLETLPYWLEQMRATRPDTPLARFTEDTVRELLATHAVQVLPRLLRPGTLQPDLLLVRQVYRQTVPPWAPVAERDGEVQLRSDPFGYAFVRTASGVESPGLEIRKFLTRTQGLRQQLEQECLKRGRPPADIDEAITWGCRLPPPPVGGRWDLSQTAPSVVWPEPPQPAWGLR